MVTFILDRPYLCGQQTSVLLVDANFRSEESEFSHHLVHLSNRPVSGADLDRMPDSGSRAGNCREKGSRNKLVTLTNRMTSADLVGERAVAGQVQ